MAAGVYVEHGEAFSEQPFAGENCVEFRLLYSGRVLSASRTDTRASLKHEIRQEFHPQLKRLWETKEGLRELAQTVANRSQEAYPESYRTRIQAAQNLNERRQAMCEYGISLLGKNWNRAGFNFVPVVTEQLCLRCSLDILFLRPEEPGRIVQSGDLDGRIKILFDALRIPKDASETGGASPSEGQEPFFVLLEDDKLISEIRVTTDPLLMLPKQKQIDVNDAFLVIHVKLEATQPSGHFSNAFGF